LLVCVNWRVKGKFVEKNEDKLVHWQNKEIEVYKYRVQEIFEKKNAKF